MHRRIDELVQRLYSDPTFRTAFLKSPDSALAGADFSEDERRAITRLRLRLAALDGSANASIAGPMDGGWP